MSYRVTLRNIKAYTVALTAASFQGHADTLQVSAEYFVPANNQGSCKAADPIDIYAGEEPLSALPDGFSPGSGANGEFKIIRQGIANLNYFRIFNRWGNMVSETPDTNQIWNRVYNGCFAAVCGVCLPGGSNRQYGGKYS
jgi:hypothetical protein